GQLECPGQISRAVFIGQGEGLFLAQAEGARFLVVVDVAAGCLGSQPFAQVALVGSCLGGDRKSTRLISSHVAISYAVFCLKKKRRRCAPPRSRFRPSRGPRDRSSRCRAV